MVIDSFPWSESMFFLLAVYSSMHWQWQQVTKCYLCHFYIFVNPAMAHGRYILPSFTGGNKEFLPKGSMSLILQDLCAFMTSRPRPPGPRSIFNMTARSRLLAQSDFFLWHDNIVTLIQCVVVSSRHRFRENKLWYLFVSNCCLPSNTHTQKENISL